MEATVRRAEARIVEEIRRSMKGTAVVLGCDEKILKSCSRCREEVMMSRDKSESLFTNRSLNSNW